MGTREARSVQAASVDREDFREPKVAWCLVAVGKCVVQESWGCMKL